MQTLYAIHINQANQVSVDVFSEKHSGVAKWRMYFAVRPCTLARLRRIYAAKPKAFYINREWSPARWKAYKTWGIGDLRRGEGALAGSLDSLATSERPQ